MYISADTLWAISEAEQISSDVLERASEFHVEHRVQDRIGIQPCPRLSAQESND